MSYFFEDITIKNFKVFKSAKTFKLGRINVLTGKNNSGKSSLIEFIDLLNKSINLRNLASFPLSELKGAKSFEDCLNIQSKSKNLEVKIPVKLDYFASDDKYSLKLKFEQSKNYKSDGVLSYYAVSDSFDKCVLSYQFFEEAPDYSKFKYSFIKTGNSVQTEHFNLPGIKIKLFCDFILLDTYFRNRIIKLKKSKPIDWSSIVMRPEDMPEDVYRESMDSLNEFIEEETATKPNFRRTDFYENKRAFFSEETNQFGRADSFDPELKKIDLSKSDLFFIYKFKHSERLIDRDDKQYLKLKKIERQRFNLETVRNDRSLLDPLSSMIGGELDYVMFESYREKINSEINDLGVEIVKLSDYGNLIMNKIILTLRGISRMLKEQKIDIVDAEKERKEQSILSSLYNIGLIKGFPEDIFLKSWLGHFGFGQDYNITVNNDRLCFNVLSNGEYRDVSTYGKGLQNLIEFLLAIVKRARYNHLVTPLEEYKPSIMIAIEPDSNLHPNLQSMLADMFIDAASKFNIRFIIESHSEYLLWKLQYWTIKKKIKSEDVFINYFEKNNKTDASSIRQITIDDNGNFSDELGEGFVDHTPKLMFDILSLKLN